MVFFPPAGSRHDCNNNNNNNSKVSPPPHLIELPCWQTIDSGTCRREWNDVRQLLGSQVNKGEAGHISAGAADPAD
jgi:hypothetical protein